MTSYIVAEAIFVFCLLLVILAAAAMVAAGDAGAASIFGIGFGAVCLLGMLAPWLWG